jgi:hypothetical protein
MTLSSRFKLRSSYQFKTEERSLCEPGRRSRRELLEQDEKRV